MPFQKAGLCPAATRMTFRTTTFPLVVAAPAIAGTLLPGASHVDASDAVGRIGTALAWWSSIVLASLPYVTLGALFATIQELLSQRWRRIMVIAALVAPGCDCASAGYASAFAREAPAIAGFVLVWSCAAGPAALLGTYSALGEHLLFARLAGAFIAAALTAVMWRLDIRGARAEDRDAKHSRHDAASEVACGRIASALVALAVSASIATVGLMVFGHNAVLSTPVIAAAGGALMSPCSTADAVIARVLVHRSPSQIAFVLAAQTIDIRQLVTLARVFGPRRCALAALAGAAGCAVGALCAM
ncbi:MAG TPA: hypothetical protein VFO25_02020 [Candidatus Eremiobacteraceae bacterium]|nr:hypothetical protein [Candidatus Eremiobacteraceae bacterium]